jgi:hypothetical protein
MAKRFECYHGLYSPARRTTCGYSMSYGKNTRNFLTIFSGGLPCPEAVRRIVIYEESIEKTNSG